MKHVCRSAHNRKFWPGNDDPWHSTLPIDDLLTCIQEGTQKLSLSNFTNSCNWAVWSPSHLFTTLILGCSVLRTCWWPDSPVDVQHFNIVSFVRFQCSSTDNERVLSVVFAVVLLTLGECLHKPHRYAHARHTDQRITFQRVGRFW